MTSDETMRYNCISHSFGRDDMWSWPEEIVGVYWPDGVRRELTLECFIIAFGAHGYTRCEGDGLENGFEKVAIYVDASGEPTHAARQLPSGSWTSKLGDWEDIEHKTLRALEDDARSRGLGYGKVGQVLKRPIGG